MPTLWAIDATNWLHVLWHGMGGGDVLTPFLKRLDAISGQYKPAAMIAAFDVGESFRKGIDIAYKSNRTEYPENLTRQIDEAAATLPPWCPPVGVDGFEADDMLATAARVAVERGWRCVLGTGDKDARQCLVQGSVTICRKMIVDYGTCRPDWYTAADLLRDYGLTPGQFVDFQTIAGDSTDCIAGCKGIGPETAKEILQKVGTLEAALCDQWRLHLPPKRKAALQAFKTKAEHYRSLVRLRTDVPGVEELLPNT